MTPGHPPKKPKQPPIPSDIREVMGMAGDIIRPIIRATRSERTTRNYRNLYARLLKVGLTPLQYAQEIKTTKGAYYVFKAAWQWGLAHEIDAALTTLYSPLTNIEKDHPLRMRAEIILLKLLPKLLDQHPDYSKEHLGEKIDSAYSTTRKKAGKRKSIRGLPADWRERMLAAATPAHKLTVAISAATGCRPAELAKGIMIERDGEKIVAVIGGAKVRYDKAGKIIAGIIERRMVLDPASGPQVKYIADTLLEGGTVVVNRWTAGDAIRSAAAKCGFKRVTPYSLRHQFAADRKGEGMSNDEIAELLGHKSERTQQHYGHAQQGKGRGGVRSATKAKATDAPAPEKNKLPDFLGRKGLRFRLRSPLSPNNAPSPPSSTTKPARSTLWWPSRKSS